MLCVYVNDDTLCGNAYRKIICFMFPICYSVGNTLQRAKRRMEDQFNKFGFGRGKKKDGSIEETQGSCMYKIYYIHKYK